LAITSAGLVVAVGLIAAAGCGGSSSGKVSDSQQEIAARGCAARDSFLAPFVVGEREGTAMDQLRAAGFEVQTLRGSFVDRKGRLVPPGVVSAQSPPPNQRFCKGKALFITIYVATGRTYAAQRTAIVRSDLAGQVRLRIMGRPGSRVVGAASASEVVHFAGGPAASLSSCERPTFKARVPADIRLAFGSMCGRKKLLVNAKASSTRPVRLVLEGG
jgi:hypothetical protein